MLLLQKFDEIKQYTRLICDQIRYKKVHDIISEEIENHIIDQRDAFIDQGFDEATATDKAIKEMGDAVIVGSELDRTHRPKPEWSIIFLTIFMLFVGLSVNFFVGMASASPELFFQRFAIGMVLGIVCMVVAYFVDFTIIGKYSIALFISLAIITFIFMISSRHIHPQIAIIPLTGERTWLYIPVLGSISANALMLLFPMLYSGIVYTMRNKRYRGIILCGIFYLIPISFGSATISNIFMYTSVCLILLSISICKGWFNVNRLYGMLLVFIPVVAVIISQVPALMQSSRFQVLLDPHIAPMSAGFNAIVIRDVLNGANFIGQGYFHNDIYTWLFGFNTYSVIVYLVHRLGWISAIGIFLIMSILIARGLYLCFKQKSILGQLVSVSVLLTFTMQILTYMFANLGFPLFHHNTLPFISLGKNALAINLTLVGVMLSVFKTNNLVQKCL